MSDLTTRIRWLAAGYARSGDRFRAASSAWYRRPFVAPSVLWNHLEDFAQRSDAWVADNGLGPVIPALDLSLMSAKPDAISEQLKTLWEILQEWRASGREKAPAPGVERDKGDPKAPGGSDWEGWYRAWYCSIYPTARGCPAEFKPGAPRGKSLAVLILALLAISVIASRRR